MNQISWMLIILHSLLTESSKMTVRLPLVTITMPAKLFCFLLSAYAVYNDNWGIFNTQNLYSFLKQWVLHNRQRLRKGGFSFPGFLLFLCRRQRCVRKMSCTWINSPWLLYKWTGYVSSGSFSSQLAGFWFGCFLGSIRFFFLTLHFAYIPALTTPVIMLIYMFHCIFEFSSISVKHICFTLIHSYLCGLPCFVWTDSGYIQYIHIIGPEDRG